MIGLGSATQLGIGIAVVLQDQFSTTANRVNAQMQAMKKNAHSAALGAMRDYRDQQAAIAVGFGAVAAGAYSLAKEGAQIQHKINQIAVIGGSAIGKTREQLAEMGSSIGMEFARRPGEMADAMLENVRAGVTKNLDVITRYQTAAASITGEQLGGENGVAVKLLGIQHAMGINSKDFGRVANATAAAANISMASIHSIGESMEYAAFTARQFNIPLEQTLALVAKLSQARIEGSSAGVALQNMISRLGQSVGVFRTKKQMKAWDILGIDPDAMKLLMDKGKIFDVIATVEKASAKLGASDKGSVLPTLLNVRGTRGVLAAFGDPNNPQSSLENMLKGIQGGVKSNIAINQGAAATADLASDMVRATAAWDEFKRAFSEAVAPTLQVMLHVGIGLAKVFSSIASTPVGKILAGITVTVIPLIAVLSAFRAAMVGLTMVAVRYAEIQGAGGFSSMMGAGLGMLPRIGGKSASMARAIQAGTVRQNAAGRWIVTAGNKFNWGGKTFNPGFLPKTFNPSGSLINGVGMGASLLGGGTGTLSKVASLLGKAGPIAGTILGLIPEIAGVAIGIMTIATIATSIYDWLMDDGKKKTSPPEDMEKFYLRQLNRVVTNTPENGAGGSTRTPFTQSKLDQTINLYIDGKKQTTRVLNKGWSDVDESFMIQNMH